MIYHTSVIEVVFEVELLILSKTFVDLIINIQVVLSDTSEELLIERITS